MGAGEGGGSGGWGGREKWGQRREREMGAGEGGGRYKSSALPPINKRPHTHNAAHLSTVSGSTMRYKQRGGARGRGKRGQREEKESERAKIGREKRKRARKDDWWREGEMRMKEGG